MRLAILALFLSSLLTAQDFTGIKRDIAAHADVPGLAVAVVQHGKILYEDGFGFGDRERHMRATPHTAFALASVSKSITATAIMQLSERGKLHLDAPVNDYLASAKLHSPRWNPRNSTVRRVLSHTGGLTTFTRRCRPGDSRCDLDREIRDYGVLVWPPAEVFDYSNLGFGILGYVVARASGQTYDAYLKEALFTPLGMRDCGLVVSHPSAQYDEKTHARSPVRVSGTPGASGLRCSAHDLALFGMFQLKDAGTPKGLVSPAALDEMHRAQDATRGQYGLGWWIAQRGPNDIVSAQGGTTDSYALLELVPSKDVAVVVLANSYSKFVSDLGDRILATLAPNSATPTSPPIKQTASPASSSVIGRWNGEVLVLGKPVRISLDVSSDGVAHAKLVDQPLATLKNVSIKPAHFYGELSASGAIADAPAGDFVLDLDLALHGDELLGAATAHLPAGEEGDQLPHWAHFSRAK